MSENMAAFLFAIAGKPVKNSPQKREYPIDANEAFAAIHGRRFAATIEAVTDASLEILAWFQPGNVLAR